jgi:glycosyltransferase involved in cell wall biosynthesis
MTRPAQLDASAARRAATRVVHVSSAHPWTDIRIHQREARTLAEAGYDVHLVAVDNRLSAPETGVKAVRQQRRSRANRVLIGSISAVIAGLRTRAQIVHLHDPELIWAIPLLRVLRKTVIYDAHEDLPSQLRDKSYIPMVIRAAVSRLSLLVVKVSGLANHVVAATERIADRYSPSKVTVIRNYPRIRDADSNNSAVETRQKKLVYVGAISESRGALQMLDALASDAFPTGWTLELAGSIVPAELEVRMRNHPAWGIVNYHGVVSPDEARDIVSGARIGLVTLQANAAYVDSLPTKLFEYLAAGMPVIASDFPLWRRIVEANECGTLVDQTNPESIAAAIAEYETDVNRLAAEGRNALRASRGELNWDSEATALVSLYDKLALRPSSSSSTYQGSQPA